MNRNEIEIYKKYHTPGCQNYVRRPKNAVFVSAGNSLIHEITKAIICWELSKEGHNYITECVPNKDGHRRIDVLNITTEDQIEIETNGREFKAGSKTYYIVKKETGWEIIEKRT